MAARDGGQIQPPQRDILPSLEPSPAGRLAKLPVNTGMFAGRMRDRKYHGYYGIAWLGDLDSNQGCPGQSREFYR